MALVVPFQEDPSIRLFSLEALPKADAGAAQLIQVRALLKPLPCTVVRVRPRSGPCTWREPQLLLPWPLTCI